MIRDQGDKQLDLIGKINMGRIKSIGFQNERSINLEKETKDKKKDTIKKSRSNKGEEKKRAVFAYTATDNTSFDFNEYTCLMSFLIYHLMKQKMNNKRC